MKPTLQEKYDFLCSFFKVTDIDLWENDALLKLDTSNSVVYFQFGGDDGFPTVDTAVENLLSGV